MAIVAIKDLSAVDAGCGLLFYNGITFNSLRRFSLVGEDVYDDAKRTITHVDYTLTASTIIFNSTETDQSTQIAAIRTALQQPGKTLKIVDVGFGDIIINDGGNSTHNEVNWGPMPQTFDVGYPMPCCCEVVWVCKFSIRECSGDASNMILAFNYNVDWAMDDSCLWQRVVSGYLQIRQTRSNGGTRVATSADAYRERIRVQIPNGFRRGPQRYHLSDNRNRLDFQIVDLQLEGEAPPEGMIRADLNYSISTAGDGFAKWIAVFSGSLEVAPGRPASAAGQTFLDLMIARWNLLLNGTGGKGTVIPTRLQLSHKIGTRVSEFVATFFVTSCLDDILKVGGVWQPLGTDYAKWAASMQAAWSVRGIAGLAFNPSTDAIVDLCTGDNLPTIRDNGGVQTPSVNQSKRLTLKNISKANSFLGYSNSLRIIREQNYSLHKVCDGYLPDALIEAADGVLAAGVQLVSTLSAGTPRKDVTQYKSGPSELIVMEGYCQRIEHEPGIPRLLTINDQPVEVVKEVIDGPKVIGCLLDSPIYQARWAIVYRPKTGYVNGPLPPRKNPSICCDPPTAK